MSFIRRLRNKLKELPYFLYKWLLPIVDPVKLVKLIPSYVGYFKDWFIYSNSENAEPVELINAHPCLYDKTPHTPHHKHYFYQHAWAFKRIFESKARYHVDVGSFFYLASSLSAVTRTTFIDIRPLRANLNNLSSIKANILSMPYKANSLKSISCLHVIEHIGLGRYGDLIDPRGSKKAARELSRILGYGGNLFLSLPVGKPRLIFNAHRIHSTKQVLDYFYELKLLELSGVDDEGNFFENIDRTILDSCNYGCGFFWFSKR